LPPSLVNIYKELEAEYRTPFLSRSGDLTAWAEQGVLLLNATLTVTGGANTAGSHQKKGWEQITDAAIRHLSETREGLVYFLWGNAAQKKASLIDATRNLVLCAAHPSPLSAYRGFFGCNHFVKCTAYLAARGETPIAW
jgi:uracil-DNA glycosylase